MYVLQIALAKPIAFDPSKHLVFHQDRLAGGPEGTARVPPTVDRRNCGVHDMEQSVLVKHTIDTGDTRPIRLPLRWFPISKQQPEQGDGVML